MELTTTDKFWMTFSLNFLKRNKHFVLTPTEQKEITTLYNKIARE